MSDLLSTFQEKPTDESLKDGCKQGHDQSGNSGSWDPAVLAMGPARRPLVYTLKELQRLRNSPLVKRGLENAFAGCEALALVLKKRPDSPNDDDRGAKGDAPNENHKGVYGRERRSADPRERVRKESACEGGGGAGGGSGSGIVLSPQRRSFTSGCGASVPAAPQQPPHVARTRPESPLSQQQPAKQDQGRRIGSGRIMVRDENRSGWEEPEYRAEPYRPPLARERDRNADRYDRRSFTRDSYSSDIKRERDDRFINDKPRDREDNRRSGGRYSQRRFEKEDEPEWMSGGPTSQLETIELRGFDEPIKKNGTSSGKENEKWNPNGRGRSSDRERWRSEPPPPSPPAAPAQPKAPKQHNNIQEKDPQPPPPPVPEPKQEEPQNNEQPDFNLDEFLKFDTIPEVLTNGTSEPAGSRFSRWFRKESSPTDKHYERYLNNMVDELDISSRPEGVGGPESEMGVFAPISPAARPPVSLLDMLRRANTDQRQEMNPIGGGKMQSLEELEARMRQSAPPPHSDQDLTAFKRLLAQVSGGHAVPAAGEPTRHVSSHSQPPPSHQSHPQHQPPPASHHQPMALFQMLNKNMEQQPKVAPPQQPHIPQDLLYKLLHVQRQQQQQQQQEVGNVADRELLQRPEAQAILHGLKAGEITVQHLLQQLNNPGLQSRHREVLHTILRLQHQRQMGGSPLPGTGAPPHLVVPPHHHQLPISPLPHQAFCVSPIMPTSPNMSVPHPGVPTRIPSPRELAAHTQSIMQGALIKKKLEEQKENYRRRHEMQHQAKQPTPISFTPTSVLRKMTADKESDVLSPKQQQWSQPPKMPQGRPIVKGNQSGAAPSMGYTPAPLDYQQHYLNHQQQMSGGMRSYSLPQQRQQVPASLSNLNNMNMNNMNSITRGVAAGTTIHQLIVQTHQRSLNEMSVANAAGGGGGDNQLTRWFSPELLARASAGKLPSVHMPNALSLEDLERHHHSPAPPLRN